MEVFKRTQLDFGGAFAADRGILTLSGGLSPVLVQNLNLTYAQQVTRLYELGEYLARQKVYYVGGRSQGNMTVARVIGPAQQLALFYDRYGDVCRAGDNTIGLSLANSCGDGAFGNALAPTQAQSLNLINQNAIYLWFCVLTQVGAAVGAQDLIISESNQIMFSNMDYMGP